MTILYQGSIGSSVFFVVPRSVRAYAARLDYPQSALYTIPFQRWQRCGQDLTNHRKRVSSRAQHHNSWSPCRWKTQRIGEIQVERNQYAAIFGALAEQALIGNAAQPFRNDRVSLMAAIGQKGCKPAVKILVELESHAACCYVGSGITRSRVTSAA